ncbi:phage terminase large subunit family protein, partial [Escherichia coli 93.0055]
LSKTG